MNKKQKMFGTGKHRKILVASTIAWMTMVSGMFSNASNISMPSNSWNITSQPQTKQKTGIKKIFHTSDENIKQALENKDYEKFSQIIEKKLSKDEFEKLSKKYILNQSIWKAIEENNFRDFQIASKWTYLQTTSQEEFEEMVAKNIARKTGL